MSDDRFNEDLLDSGGPEGDSNMPLLPDFGAQAQQYAAPASPRRRRVIVGALVVVGAAVGILAMRLVGLGAATVLAAITVDLSRPGLTNVDVPQDLLDGLDRSRRAVQVPSDLVERNPFLLRSANADTANSSLTEEELNARELLRQQALERQRREQYEASIDAAIRGFELQSIVGGSRPVARINNKVVQVGSALEAGSSEARFVVESIEGREVVIAVDERRYMLELGVADAVRLPDSK